MKKLLSTLSLFLLFNPFFEVTKANEYKYLKRQISGNGIQFPNIEIWGVKEDGTSLRLNTFTGSDNFISESFEDGHIDEYEGKLYFDVNEHTNAQNNDGTWPGVPSAQYVLEYDLIENTFTKRENAPDDFQLYPKTINTMITQKSDGSVHIGENSAVFKEEKGRENFWAQDANGKSIPINITNGSKLLINGRDVEQSINNVGALSAALTGLPTVPTDTTLACGLGTGTHGGDFAFSGGCASKVNDKLSINYAASMTIPGQDYAGDFEDKFSARAGFVWKLGKSIKPTQISSNQKKVIDLKISKLQKDNELLKADNKELKNKNNKIISQNEKLLARLEKLENIAFKLQKNDGLKLSQGILE